MVPKDAVKDKFRENKIREYFYGPKNNICPHVFTMEFSDIKMYKIGAPQIPDSCLPAGMVLKNPYNKILPIAPSKIPSTNRDMFSSVVRRRFSRSSRVIGEQFQRSRAIAHEESPRLCCRVSHRTRVSGHVRSALPFGQATRGHGQTYIDIALAATEREKQAAHHVRCSLC